MCILISLLCITTGILGILINPFRSGSGTATVTAEFDRRVTLNSTMSLAFWGGIACLVAAIGPIVMFFLVLRSRNQEREELISEQVVETDRSRERREKKEERREIRSMQQKPEKEVLIITPNGVDPLVIRRLEYIRDNSTDSNIVDDATDLLNKYAGDPKRYGWRAKWLTDLTCDTLPNFSCPGKYNKELVERLELGQKFLADKNIKLSNDIGIAVNVYKTNPSPENERNVKVLADTICFSNKDLCNSNVPAVDQRLINNLNFIRDNMIDGEKSRIDQMIDAYRANPVGRYDATSAFVNGYCLSSGVSCPIAT
jgi:hypothetical protein